MRLACLVVVDCFNGRGEGVNCSVRTSRREFQRFMHSTVGQYCFLKVQLSYAFVRPLAMTDITPSLSFMVFKCFSLDRVITPDDVVFFRFIRTVDKNVYLYLGSIYLNVHIR